jgi:pyruvate dehydrogenase E1 component alpha subunit
MMTYRYRGHSMSDPAKYRTREEVQDIREHHDPIERIRARIIEKGHAKEDELKTIETAVRDRVVAAAEYAQAGAEPDAAELWTDITH